MSDLDRDVAGIRCRDVLRLLGDYVDGTLPNADVDRVEAHLRGCDRCEKFGGEYGSLVAALRRRLGAPADPPPHVREGLAARMRSAWSEDQR